MSEYTLSHRTWLTLLCRQLKHAKRALCYEYTDNKVKIAAAWPTTQDGAALSASHSATLNQAFTQTRLHIHPLNKGAVLLLRPFKLKNTNFLFAVELSQFKKNELPHLLNYFQQAQNWLELTQVLALKPATTLAQNTAKTPADQAFKIAPAPELSFIAALLNETSIDEFYISFVNRIAELSGATRVSLATSSNNNLSLRAISQVATIDTHSEAMQNLLHMLYECKDQRRIIELGETSLLGEIHSQESIAHNNGTLKNAHQAFFTKQKLSHICSLPLIIHEQVIGVVCLEFNKKIKVNPKTLLNSLHLGAGLLLLKQQGTQSWWQHLRLSSHRFLQALFGGQSYKLKAFSALAIILLALMMIPMTYHIKADALLTSEYKYILSSPREGYLANVYKQPGDHVEANTLLARLDDKELLLEQQRLHNLFEQHQQSYDTALALEQRANASIASSQMQQVQLQIELLSHQLQRSEFRAPHTGIIISPDIRQRLGGPVKQGEVLFELASGDHYQVEILVDERDINHVTLGEPAELKISALPSERFQLKVIRITPLSIALDGQNRFTVIAELSSTSPNMRPGMTGKAHISASKRSLGWILFHKSWYWLALRLW